jgi:hypothetical protein
MAMRFLDLVCHACETELYDKFYMEVPDVIPCPNCNNPMDRLWTVSRRNAEWSDRDAIVVYRKPDGSISYPGRNDAPTPAGCERITMRSLRQVESFERQHGVRSEIAWYDKGSGRGHDDMLMGRKDTH